MTYSYLKKKLYLIHYILLLHIGIKFEIKYKSLIIYTNFPTIYANYLNLMSDILIWNYSYYILDEIYLIIFNRDIFKMVFLVHGLFQVKSLKLF